MRLPQQEIKIDQKAFYNDCGLQLSTRLEPVEIYFSKDLSYFSFFRQQFISSSGPGGRD